MEEIIERISFSVTDSAFSAISANTKNNILEMFTTATNWINTTSSGFWDNEIVLALLNSASILSVLSLVIGVVFLMHDIAEQIEQIDIKIVMFALAKGFVFPLAARWIALSFFYAAQLIITQFNFKLDPNSLTNLLNSFPFIGEFTTIIFMIIILIATIIFFFMQLNCVAAMFVHIISVFVYVPFIVCGDSQKIKEWISSALSIALTYCIQYICFYSGINIMVSGNFIIGIIFITASFIASKELKQLGHSTGAANSLRGSASMAYQAVMGLKSMGVV